MATQNENDPEGYLLAETRRILGEDVPIVISLDLHGILTDRMLEHSDAAVAFHTYPHVDFFRTGERAARLLLRIVAGDVRPVTAKVTVPALVRGDELITETGSIRHAVNAAKAIEQRPGGLSAAMMWGNPFTDVPEPTTIRRAPSVRRCTSRTFFGSITRRCRCRSRASRTRRASRRRTSPAPSCWWTRRMRRVPAR